MSGSPAPTDAEVLRRFLAKTDVACPGCGYNLRALSKNVCPECGITIRLKALMRGRARPLPPHLQCAFVVQAILSAVLFLAAGVAGSLVMAAFWVGVHAAIAGVWYGFWRVGSARLDAHPTEAWKMTCWGAMLWSAVVVPYAILGSLLLLAG